MTTQPEPTPEAIPEATFDNSDPIVRGRAFGGVIDQDAAILARGAELARQVRAANAEAARTRLHETLVAHGATHEAVTEVLDALTAAGYDVRSDGGYGYLADMGEGRNVLVHHYAIFGVTDGEREPHRYSAVRVVGPWERVPERDADAAGIL